jgi:hypothetical protein
MTATAIAEAIGYSVETEWDVLYVTDNLSGARLFASSFSRLNPGVRVEVRAGSKVLCSFERPLLRGELLMEAA